MLSPASVADFSPSDFADNELDLPYYLSHFHRIANAVEMDGPDCGFINISVWRNSKDNKPHNARIMENILALAFFFCTERPWNVFYAQPDLRQRLEAALAWTSGAVFKMGMGVLANTVLASGTSPPLLLPPSLWGKPSTCFTVARPLIQPCTSAS